MNKLESQERSIITTRPEKRPYGAKFEFQVMTHGDLGNLKNVCFLLETGEYLTITTLNKASWEAGQKIQVELEGFTTAAKAELSGQKLIQAFLWCAIKSHRSLKLNYQTYEPVYVFERNRSQGISFEGYADNSLPPNLVINDVCSGYSNLPNPDPQILLSMEVFASSKLETSERAKYLSMVSAFELLADCKSLGIEVSSFVKNTITSLKLNQEISEQIKNSLLGRIKQLEKESIRQSLKRFIREYVPELPEAESQLDEAYSIRSQITHAGKPNSFDVDLNIKMFEFQELVIKVYRNILKK